jgi:hypothetical protein
MAGASEAVDAKCKSGNIEKQRIPIIIKTRSFCMSSPSSTRVQASDKTCGQIFYAIDGKAKPFKPRKRIVLPMEEEK